MHPFADPRTFAMQEELRRLCTYEASKHREKMVLIYSDGDVKIEQLEPELSPQFVGLRDYILKKICEASGVPVYLMNDPSYSDGHRRRTASCPDCGIDFPTERYGQVCKVCRRELIHA